jgi:hypothetical protein
MKPIIMIMAMLLSFNALAFDSFSIIPSDSDSYSFEKSAPIPQLEEILNQAELDATPEGKKILEMARLMISNQEIVLGSCWDYIDAIYNRSGFIEDDRETIYKSKLQGPYIDDTKKINGGDWLYFINHSYGDVEHSSIFVAWTDVEKKLALMISYAGGNQSTPARYRIYDLTSVYNIMRPR